MTATDVRSLEQIKADLTTLHAQAGQLLESVHQTRPTLRLLLRTKPLDALEETLDEHFRTFLAIDADLIRHANAPGDATTAMRNAAQYSFYTAVRDSVRGLLGDASNALSGTRGRLDFKGSLLVSLVALFASVIAIFVDVAG